MILRNSLTVLRHVRKPRVNGGEANRHVVAKAEGNSLVRQTIRREILAQKAFFGKSERRQSSSTSFPPSPPKPQGLPRA